MSKYGFDPNELIETKIDLIDKDGFHGVGEASDGGNSGGGSSDASRFIGLEEGVYGLGTYDDYYEVLYIFDKSKHPELTDDGTYNWQAANGSVFTLYFGDKRDESEYMIQDETVVVEPIVPSESNGLFEISTDYTSCVNIGHAGRYAIFSGNILIGNHYYAGEFDPAAHDGDLCHIMVPCSTVGDGHEYEQKIVQIDAIWHYNPEVID